MHRGTPLRPGVLGWRMETPRDPQVKPRYVGPTHPGRYWRWTQTPGYQNGSFLRGDWAPCSASSWTGRDKQTDACTHIQTNTRTDTHTQHGHKHAHGQKHKEIGVIHLTCFAGICCILFSYCSNKIVSEGPNGPRHANAGTVEYVDLRGTFACNKVGIQVSTQWELERALCLYEGCIHDLFSFLMTMVQRRKEICFLITLLYAW